MKITKPWHEDDFFWEIWGAIMFTDKRLREAVTHVEQIIPLLGMKPPMRVLDLGCGVGRHSLELAHQGFLVTGVDRTEHYLEQASEKAKKQNLEIEFVRDDMRNFCRPGAFDAAINLFTSFTYNEFKQNIAFSVRYRFHHSISCLESPSLDQCHACSDNYCIMLELLAAQTSVMERLR